MLVPVACGEEITISYLMPAGRTRAERQEQHANARERAASRRAAARPVAGRCVSWGHPPGAGWTMLAGRRGCRARGAAATNDLARFARHSCELLRECGSWLMWNNLIRQAIGVTPKY